jgi:hypothetical protein
MILLNRVLISARNITQDVKGLGVGYFASHFMGFSLSVDTLLVKMKRLLPQICIFLYILNYYKCIANDFTIIYSTFVCRELNRNRIRSVEGLSFHGLEKLRVLKLRRNVITQLMDGAFWGLGNIQQL